MELLASGFVLTQPQLLPALGERSSGWKMCGSPSLSFCLWNEYIFRFFKEHCTLGAAFASSSFLCQGGTTQNFPGEVPWGLTSLS